MKMEMANAKYSYLSGLLDSIQNKKYGEESTLFLSAKNGEVGTERLTDDHAKEINQKYGSYPTYYSLIFDIFNFVVKANEFEGTVLPEKLTWVWKNSKSFTPELPLVFVFSSANHQFWERGKNMNEYSEVYLIMLPTGEILRENLTMQEMLEFVEEFQDNFYAFIGMGSGFKKEITLEFQGSTRSIEDIDHGSVVSSFYLDINEYSSLISKMIGAKSGMLDENELLKYNIINSIPYIYTHRSPNRRRRKNCSQSGNALETTRRANSDICYYNHTQGLDGEGIYVAIPNVPAFGENDENRSKRNDEKRFYGQTWSEAYEKCAKYLIEERTVTLAFRDSLETEE